MKPKYLDSFARPIVNTQLLGRKGDGPEAVTFPAFESVTRPTLDTAAAAYYLNRKPQTLRGWACCENGPIRPTRINGRLAWLVEALRKLLGSAI